MTSLYFDTFTVCIIGLLIDNFNIDDQDCDCLEDILELIIEKEPLILKFGEYGQRVSDINQMLDFDDTLYFRTEEDMVLFKLKYNV